MAVLKLKNQALEAAIDEADYGAVSCYSWTLLRTRHGDVASVVARINRRVTYLHRMLLGAKRGEVVDHKDGNPLNNARSNLRICSQAQNTRNRKKPVTNTSGFKGVHKAGSKWRARIVFDGRKQHLGCFDTTEQAHAAYCAKAAELHGDFARFG